MKKSKSWETLVWIIIGVIILSIVLVWIWSTASYSKDVISMYKDKGTINILEDSSYNIINKIDTSGVQNWETFYLYKNVWSSEFEIFTGAVNSDYQYVDDNGNKIDDIDTFEWDIFTRSFLVEWEYSTPLGTWQSINVNIERYARK